jgi:drug/metabolite transporter (DMT)-like permease
MNKDAVNNPTGSNTKGMGILLLAMLIIFLQNMPVKLIGGDYPVLEIVIRTFWGYVIWREVPTVMTIAGAALTLLSGMYILYRERR